MSSKQVPCYIVFMIISLFLFIFSSISDGGQLYWILATVTIPETNCNKQCNDLSIYMHPLAAIRLYSSPTSWLAERDRDIELFMASMILTILFLILAVFFIEEYCIVMHMMLITASLIFGSVVLGVWDSMDVKENSIIPFLNVNLMYERDVHLCLYKNQCRTEKIYNVTVTYNSLIDLTVNNITYGTGYYMWIIGLFILCVVYVGLIIWQCFNTNNKIELK